MTDTAFKYFLHLREKYDPKNCQAMFASSGYFKTIPCPYFVSGLCERPYCHFKHAAPEEKKEKALHVPYARAAPASSVLSAGLSGGNFIHARLKMRGVIFERPKYSLY